MDNLKICKSCKQNLPLSNFNRRKVAKDGLQPKCKKCNKLYKIGWHASIKEEARAVNGQITERFANNKIALYKTRSKSKNYTFDLTAKYLIDAWKQQEGKCFYTKQDLIITENFTFWTATLDRLDPDKGYTQGNVVWVLHGVNCFKQELTLNEFLTFVNSVGWPKL